MSSAVQLQAAHDAIDLVYVRPFVAATAFEARLASIASRFANRLRLVKGSAIELSRFTDEAVFTSPTVPTVVLVRRGEVIAQAVGDLPASELTRLVAGAIA